MDARQREQLIADLYVALVVRGQNGGCVRRGDIAKKAIAYADELVEQLEPSGAGTVLDCRHDRVGDDATDRA